MSDDVRDLIAELAQQESAAAASPFLAPCVPGATVRTRVAGLVRSFSPRPENFEGWGVFRARRGDVSDRVARLEREADLPEVDRYLAALPRMGLWLIHVLRGRTWLALPMNGSDAKQRFGREGPVAVRLVDDGSPMDRIEAAFDGAAWWFAGEDRRADPFLSQQLRDSSALSTELDVPGLTPELRDAYRIAYDPLPLPLIEEPAPARRVTEPSHGEPELDRIRRALLVPGSEHWPRFHANRSAQFEARLSQVEIGRTDSPWFAGMAGATLPVVVSHGEGRAVFSDATNPGDCPVVARYVDGRGRIAERYPANPNGSTAGVAMLTNTDGRVA
ncbi:MAG: phosphoribosylformylglycinamidine synthase subunit PurQ, partial [Myxococcota bacterium]